MDEPVGQHRTRGRIHGARRVVAIPFVGGPLACRRRDGRAAGSAGVSASAAASTTHGEREDDEIAREARVPEAGDDGIVRLIVPGLLRVACRDVGFVERERVAGFERGLHQAWRVLVTAKKFPGLLGRKSPDCRAHRRAAMRCRRGVRLHTVGPLVPRRA